MLTIKSPIKIRCKAPMETMHRDFSEKIIGNYSMMNSRLRKEELLYVTTQAPEVYFAEGNSISILNDVNISSNQDIKLDMINNLINRILVSGTENFTYQDSVYISNVLRKLGITDVNNFMKNVHMLQEEKKENNKLINIYQEQKKLLTSVFEQLQPDKSSMEVNNENNTEYHNRYYIHEDIYNRLDTYNVYNEVQQFSKGLEKDTVRIFNTELIMGEQSIAARNFHLHNLKKEIFNSNETINYFHANSYELMEQEDDKLSEATQQERITSAILLNIVDEMYSLRMNNIEKNNHNWYILASALFQTADNTWKRYESYHSENRYVNKDMYSTMVQLVENKKQENNIINNIVREMRNINEIDEQVENQLINNVMQTINNTSNVEHIIQKNKYENKNTTVNQQQSDYNRYENIDRINKYEDETVNIDYLEEINNMIDENQVSEQISEITRQQLDEINRKNIENYKKIQEIEVTRPHITNVEINKEKARADMLRAINSPQEVIMEYLQSQTDNSFEEINNMIDSEVFNLFSDETKAIFNQYLQQKHGQTSIEDNTSLNINNNYNSSEHYNTDINMEHREYAENIVESEGKEVNILQQQTDKHYNDTNIHNIYQRETGNITTNIKVSSPHITNVEFNKGKNKADMLRAINSPQEVIMEYLRTQTNNSFEEIKNMTDSEILNLFSDETREIFNQYLQQKNSQISNYDNINSNINNNYTDSEQYNTDISMEHRTYTENIVESAENEAAIVRQQTNNNYNETNINNTNEKENVTVTIQNIIEKLQTQIGKAQQESLFITEANTRINNRTDNVTYQNNPVIMEHADTEIVSTENIENITNERRINTANNLENIKKIIQQQNSQISSDNNTNINNNYNNSLYNDSHIDMEYRKYSDNTDETYIESSVKYEINEVIQKNIEQLRSYSENNLYNSFIMNGTDDGSAAILNKGSGKNITVKKDSPELQHFIMESQNQETIVQSMINERTIMTSKVGLVHKVEEQIITEELINTIRNRAIDNHKEETIEHNTSNIVKNEKQVQETVNSIKIDKHNNIEEIVQRNVQKQINHISDQVYGKIEKKLQTERKRRGF